MSMDFEKEEVSATSKRLDEETLFVVSQTFKVCCRYKIRGIMS